MSKAVKKFYCFFLAMIFVSCTDYDTFPKFDEVLYEETKSEWTKKNLKNYSFEYEIFPYSWGPISLKGSVVVSDGESSVKILENNNNEFEEKYCLKTIEDVFEIMKSKYNEAVSYVKSEKHEYYSCEIQSYDKVNSIPTDFQLISVGKYKKGVDGDSGFFFRIKITNFLAA